RQDVPEEEEEEEAGDLHAQELRAQGAHVLRPGAGMFRGVIETLKRPKPVVDPSSITKVQLKPQK
ncbi:hypothetical protein M9458_041065, partial [Cirrhinus mrigala]